MNVIVQSIVGGGIARLGSNLKKNLYCSLKANMSTEKSFTKGSAAPGPVPKGHVRLYSMRFCPFSQRARLVLNAKGIKFDIMNIHLRDKPEWYLERNPFGVVPTLETSAGEVVYESSVICDFLDEVHPEKKKLLPSSPYDRAQQKMMLEYFTKITQYMYKIPMDKNNGEDVSGLEDELKEKFIILNEHLLKKKTKFFGGDDITMIDYMMWPWFERLEVFDLKHCLDRTADLKRWMENMMEDPSVKATRHSVDKHKAFYKTYVDGKPDFDYDL